MNCTQGWSASSDIGTADGAAFIDRAFQVVLGRPPTAEERAACETAAARWRALPAADAVQTAGVKPAAAETAAQTVDAHVVWALLNHNDFLTLR